MKKTTVSIYVIIGLLFAAILLYGTAIPYEFIGDDYWRIVTNSGIQSLSHPLRFFTDIHTQSSSPGLNFDGYRPLTSLSYAIDYHFFGENPAFYRIENILIHVMNATLIFLYAFTVLNIELFAAIAATALFFVHPAQVESVVWIVGRPNLIGVFAILLALLFWDRFRKGKNPTLSLGIVYAAQILGLLFRETPAMIPCLILVKEIFDFRVKETQSIEKSVPHLIALFVIVFIYAKLRTAMIGSVGIASYWGASFALNTANAINGFLIYLSKMLCPANLSIDYSLLPIVNKMVSPGVILGSLLIGMFLFLSANLFLRKKSYGFLFVWFLILWFPTSNLIPLNVLFADRFLYPVLISGALLVGILIHELKRWIIPLSVFSLLIITGLTALTIHQIPSWKTNISIWEHASIINPLSWYAKTCLGEAHSFRVEEGSLDHALAAYSQALQLNPPQKTISDIYYHMAVALALQGKTKEAKEFGQKAIDINPRYSERVKKFL